MEHIRVIARVMPESTNVCQPCVVLKENCTNTVEIRDPAGGTRAYPLSQRAQLTKTFALDHVFGPNASQEDIFEHVKPL